MPCHLMSDAWHVQCRWHIQWKFVVFGRFSRFKLVLRRWSTLGGVTNAVLQRNVPASRYIENAGFLLAITCCKSTGKHDIDKNQTLCRLHRATVKTPWVNTDKSYTVEKPIQFWVIPTHYLLILSERNFNTSKTPYVAIDERGLVRSIHLFLFSCVN